jgi:hypothetical protein
MLIPVLDKPFLNRRLFNYLSTLSGIAAYWPEDDANAFSRVINPAVALGRNLVINGGMALDATWTKEDASVTISGGAAHFVATPINKGVTQSLPMVIGKSYEVSVVISNYGGGSLQLIAGSGAGVAVSANGTVTQTLTCAADTTLRVRASGSAFTGDIDNVTVKQVNILASTSYPSAELLTDGNMETAGTAAWTAVGSATLTKQTSDPHGGAQYLRVAYNGTSNPRAQQTILTAGKSYRATGFMRGDGTFAPRVRTSTTNPLVAGTSSTSWQAFDVKFIAPATEAFQLQSDATGAGFAEFDDVSVTEVNPLTGIDSGVTAGISAGSRLQWAKSYDGVNDLSNIYSADLNSIFTPSVGSFRIAVQMANVGVWSDGIERHIVDLQADTSNRIRIYKATTGDLVFQYTAGGTGKTVTISGLTTTTFMLLEITWDTSAAAGSGEMKVYLNGVQQGTQTGLGAWVGNLATTTCCLGASSTAAGNPHNGLLSHAQLMSIAETPAQALTAAQRAGVAA